MRKADEADVKDNRALEDARFYRVVGDYSRPDTAERTAPSPRWGAHVRVLGRADERVTRPSASHSAKKKRTVNPPNSSQVRAQKPEIITWTGPQLHAFLTWNHDELDGELFPLWCAIAYTGMRRSEALACAGAI